MAGQQAQMAFTDPPYNVPIAGRHTFLRTSGGSFQMPLILARNDKTSRFQAALREI
jgi:hypothetical protein